MYFVIVCNTQHHNVKIKFTMQMCILNVLFTMREMESQQVLLINNLLLTSGSIRFKY